MVFMARKGAKKAPKASSSKKEVKPKAGNGKFRAPAMSVLANSYRGPSGQEYTIFREKYGDTIINAEDLEYFRSNHRFEEQKE